MGRFATTQQFFFDASWQIVRKMKKFFPLRNKIFCCVVENRPIIFFKLLRSGTKRSSTTQQFKKNNGTICHDAAIFSYVLLRLRASHCPFYSKSLSFFFFFK
uniref:hypothetical protein n=1 Tax=Cephaleuros karstenii TaxID=1985640 RepID=UPI001EDE546A|nr:hypothetical protein MFR52_pgp001 [Cephaleuros karstenii]UIB39059.1 hypothetical protein [Cephaleuros karstenii]